ncbi:glutathione metabolism protein [Rhodobacteraceae bacterium RKSG542]|nr:glutathione metabolism protein [Pseudovibrio flavus]
MFYITPIYAGVLALLFLWLSYKVVAARHETKISLGHDDDRMMLKRMRAHANFAEYVPLTLLLMLMMEMMAAFAFVLHGIGLLLLAGRGLHAFALTSKPQNLRLRALGMMCTFTALGIAAASCILMPFFELEL